MKTIRRGDKGPPVDAWQRTLNAGAKPTTWRNAAGITRSWPSTWAWPLAVDADFGQRTEWATEAWQAARGLVADAIVGPKTWGASGVIAPTPSPVVPILGVDVWSGYGVIDWHRAAKAGVRFGIAKCTQGNDSTDPSYARNVAGMKAAGVLVGAYHFAYPLRSGPGKPAGRSPREQVDRFLRAVEAAGVALDLPPALDLEWPARWDKRYTDANGNLADRWRHWDVDAAFIAEWGLECCAEIERVFGRAPLLYTYPDFWQSLGAYGKRHAWATYPLWIATYPASARDKAMPPDGATPIVYPPWTEWAIWQFSADGSPMRIDGIPVAPIDRNVVRDEATLRRLARLDT